ncbi:MAG: hypothetical protein ABEJ43_04110 [Haloferacaceae archaeon]
MVGLDHVSLVHAPVCATSRRTVESGDEATPRLRSLDGTDAFVPVGTTSVVEYVDGPPDVRVRGAPVGRRGTPS